ncbi:MAG: type IV restriction endonuclease, partial [Armatimonadetes bacterium]|nr:type IV restriction endonuclease [Armatimonadota bacterium]
MPAPTELHNLVERFTRNHARLRDPSYKEAQLRVDFLNPLFDLLGWDLTNKQGLSEQKREVITEDRLLIDGRSKAPDYSFGLGGERKF